MFHRPIIHCSNIYRVNFIEFSFCLFQLQINWDEYIGNYILGARHYLLKEKPETLPKARVLLRRLYLLDKFVSLIFYGLILWLIYSYWQNIIYSFEAVLDGTSTFINYRFIKPKVIVD